MATVPTIDDLRTAKIVKSSVDRYNITSVKLSNTKATKVLISNSITARPK